MSSEAQLVIQQILSVGYLVNTHAPELYSNFQDSPQKLNNFQSLCYYVYSFNVYRLQSYYNKNTRERQCNLGAVLKLYFFFLASLLAA